MMNLLRLIIAAFACLAALPADAAGPQRAFLGRWLVAGAQPAPWSIPGDAATAPVNNHIVGLSIIYEPGRIRGPRLLACARPRYAMHRVPPEGLFQGGLTTPAAQAAELGFRGQSIQTLQTGCAGAIDFHFIDASTALFALDNMVYTLRKQPR